MPLLAAVVCQARGRRDRALEIGDVDLVTIFDVKVDPDHVASVDAWMVVGALVGELAHYEAAPCRCGDHVGQTRPVGRLVGGLQGEVEVRAAARIDDGALSGARCGRRGFRRGLGAGLPVALRDRSRVADIVRAGRAAVQSPGAVQASVTTPPTTDSTRRSVTAAGAVVSPGTAGSSPSAQAPRPKMMSTVTAAGMPLIRGNIVLPPSLRRQPSLHPCPDPRAGSQRTRLSLTVAISPCQATFAK